jgi:flagellar biosynthesis/type III secretory pathway protein FliH
MDVKRFEEIKGLVAKAELREARAQGVIESIQKGWKEGYGFSTLEEAKKKHEELVEQLEGYTERQNSYYEKLLALCDWEALKKVV